MSYHDTSRKKDPIDRSNKGVNYAGTATFVGGRVLDPFVQYAVLKHDWGTWIITALGGSILPRGPPLITNTPLDRLGLSPYRSILLAMSAGTALKHNYWATAICQEQISSSYGLQASVGHMLGNLVNTFLYVCAQTSASVNGQYFPQTPLLVGSSMYVAGLVLEVTSEQQRFNFKQDAANKGKLYTGGLFRLSRHINLFGYGLWRVGYAVAAGGWIWGATMATLITWHATTSTIPPHQHYLEEKYGAQFEQYKKQTPYRFIPWVL